MGFSVSDAVQLNQTFNSPKWSSTDGGGWIISWFDADMTLFVERYDAAGEIIGSRVTIHEDIVYTGVFRSVTSTADGGWLISFQVLNTPHGYIEYENHISRYDSSGIMVDDHVSYEGQTTPQYKVLDNDNHVILIPHTTPQGYKALSFEVHDPQGNVIATHDLGAVAYFDAANIVTYDSGAWSMATYTFDGQIKYLMMAADGNVVQEVETATGGTVNFNDDGSYSVQYNITDLDAKTVTKVIEHFDVVGTLVETDYLAPAHYAQEYLGDQMFDLANGSTLIVWADRDLEGYDHIFMRLMDSSGEITLSDVELDLDFPWYGRVQVTELSDGRWIIQTFNKMQLFNSDGTPHDASIAILDSTTLVPTDDGGWMIGYVGQGENWYSAFYTRHFLPNDINNAPVALESTYTGTEDLSIAFDASNFAFYEPDGNAIHAIVIESLPGTGTLEYEGNAVIAGQVIAISDIDGLKWMPPLNDNGEFIDKLTFNVIDDLGVKSTQPAVLHLSASPVDDAPTGQDLTFTVREDEKFELTRDMFPVSDIEGDGFYVMDVTAVHNDGQLFVNGRNIGAHGVIEWGYNDKAFFVSSNGSGSGYAEFTVRYMTGYNQNSSEEYTVTINVLAVNDAPDLTTDKIYLNRDERTYFAEQNISLMDEENDALQSIIIESLPSYGKFKLGNEKVEVGDEIAVDDLHLLNCRVGENVWTKRDLEVTFRARDDGGTANEGQDLSAVHSFVFEVTKRNVVSGTFGDDVLEGSEGRDFLVGGAGNDTLIGGAGLDQLRGGMGNDIFVLKRGGEMDHVRDFSIEEDRIDLSATTINDWKELQSYMRSNSIHQTYIGNDSSDAGSNFGFLIFHARFNEFTESNFIFAD